jgi:hypothetical protein
MNHFQILNKYVVRSPIFPRTYVYQFKGDSESLLKNPIFVLALKTASPELFSQILNNNKKSKNYRKILKTFSKYWFRSASRPIPFGLFAGISVGEFSKKTNIQIDKIENHSISYFMDSYLLNEIIFLLEAALNVKNKLKYYPNNTIIVIDNVLRYTEFQVEKSERMYNTSEVDLNEYLEEIISKSSNGSTIKELVDFLIGSDICSDDAHSYVEDLIENKILVSEINPAITGEPALNSLIKKLDQINIRDCESLKFLKKSSEFFKTYRLNSSQKIIDNLQDISLITNDLLRNQWSKPIANANLNICTLNNCIETKVKSDLESALNILSKFTVNRQGSVLKYFKTEFLKRYGDRSMPLLFVLDPDYGIDIIGYNLEKDSIIGDLNLRNDSNKSVRNSLNEATNLLKNKYFEAIEKKQINVNLTNRELNNLKGTDISWNSFSLICSIIEDNGAYKYLLKSIGNSSALNMLTKYAHSNNQVDSILKDLSKNECVEDLLNAEISYLPKHKMGNIICNPGYLEYEIPICVNGSSSYKDRINLNDIEVSVQNDEINLYSKKHGKKIRALLTNPHNFEKDAIPVYRFLAELQFQEQNQIFSFEWGVSVSDFGFSPRLTMGNIILDRAKWIINSAKLLNSWSLGVRESLHQQRFGDLIPNKFFIAEGDNELFIDIENKESIEILNDYASKTDYFNIVEDYLQYGNSVVKDAQGNNFDHEFLYSVIVNKNKGDA